MRKLSFVGSSVVRRRLQRQRLTTLTTTVDSRGVMGAGSFRGARWWISRLVTIGWCSETDCQFYRKDCTRNYMSNSILYIPPAIVSTFLFQLADQLA